MQRTILQIAGMRSNLCREQVAEALEHIRGVTQVDVSLHRALAMVTYEPPCEEPDILRAVRDVGYAACLLK